MARSHRYLVSLILAACAPRTSGDDEIGDDESSGESDTGGESLCQLEVPANGDACSPLDIYCSWGDSPLPDCRARGQCTDSGWSVFVPSCEPEPECPADPPEVGALCPSEGLACAYLDGSVCGCTACPGPCQDVERWYCAGPPAAGCPLSPPNVGDPCSSSQGPCDYGTCAAGGSITATCVTDAWAWTNQPCLE